MIKIICIRWITVLLLLKIYAAGRDAFEASLFVCANYAILAFKFIKGIGN